MILSACEIFGFDWKAFCYIEESLRSSPLCPMTKTSAIVFFGILAIGVTTSLIVLNQKGEKVELPEEPESPSEQVETPVKKPTDPVTPEKPKDPADSPEKKEEITQAKPDGEKKEETTFRSPEKAMGALAEKIGGKDFDAFLGFVGEDAVAPAIRPEVKRIIESPKLKLDPKKPASELSKSAASVRWALNFVPAAETPGADDAGETIYVDLAGTSTDPFQFDKVSLPLDLTQVSPSETKPTPGNPAPANGDPSVTPKPNDPAEPAPLAIGAADADALTIAHAFSKAIVRRDFQAARALSDPAMVTDERVAALMIAVEEGGFDLREERPMVVTLSRDDITWVLTRIQAETMGSEFALELGKSEGWKVNGLTFSKVLSALASQAGGGDVAYSPIVEDPMGGDSLVLYFEFDDEKVTPRGNRQLAIIADILSQGADRVIRINGHADALGTDQYNEALSNNRAASIRNALISMGVSPDQVITESFGESKPRKPNFKPDGTDNPVGRSQNRRAEVYLDF